MQKGQRIDRHPKGGIRCAGHADGDAQQSHCFLSLLISSLTYASVLLFFKALLLKSFFKTLLLKSSFLFFKVSFLSLALSHVFS
jgi:hypothetical protein